MTSPAAPAGGAIATARWDCKSARAVPTRHTALLVIQPTPFCNIDCSYCYLANRLDRGRIDVGTVREFVRQTFSLYPDQTEFDVSWHAGEPTVVPAEWYEAMFEAIDGETPRGVSVRHGFQTNATLLTDAWCELFKKRDVTVGVSIDGPQEIHDACRRARSGAGTFASAMAGIERLRANHVPYSVITVLTARTLDFPEAMFDFYDSIGVEAINFNFEEIEGIHHTSSLSAPGMIERYKTFLSAFCGLLRTKRRNWRVREVSAIYGRMFGPEAAQNYQNSPGGILCCDYRGNVSTFSPELLTKTHPRYGDFVLGNIHQCRLAAMISSDKARRIASEIDEGIALCRSECGYFELCEGGAPSNKLCENGSFATAETMHCRFCVKATADAVLEMLREQVMSAPRVLS